MIKIFRKIRQRMLKENKTSKYLLYAIGEIILVVIGILIALQINNWNETRKVRGTEVALLGGLRSNLEATLLVFQEDTTFNAQTLFHLTRIQDHINRDLPYTSALDTSFGNLTLWASPYPILTGYKTLQTKGMDLVANDSLRNSIAMLYEFHFLVLSKDYDQSEWDVAQTMVHPLFAKHIRKNNISRGLARPNDFEQLKNNDEFSNVLSLLISKRKAGIGVYRETMDEIHQVIQNITIELDSRSDDN